MTMVLLVIAPFVALQLYIAAEERRLAYSEAEENLLRVTRIITTDQERMIKKTRQLLFVLAQLPVLRNGDSNGCSQLFPRLIAEHSMYINFGIIGLDGYASCSALPMEKPVYAGDQYYFKKALETGDFAVGEHQIGRITKIPLINFGYPVLDHDGAPRAVVFAALDLRWLNRLVLDARLPENAVVQMVDRSGKVWVHYPDPLKAEAQAGPHGKITEVILTKKGEGSVEAAGADGKLRLYAFRPFTAFGEENEAYIAIGIPTRDLFAAADAKLKFNIMTLGVSSLLVLGVAWLEVGLLVVRKAHKLNEATKRIASGDLSARTGLS